MSDHTGKTSNPETRSIEDIEIISIVSDSVRAENGVSRLVETGIAESLNKKVLGKESPSSGIKINRDEDKLIIGIHINVFYGVNIPQLSYDLQSKVKNAIENVTGLKVDKVNISVEGIDRVRV